MASRTFRVLFLSNRNAARSIMAEALLNVIGKGEFRAVSAGVHPVAKVDPIAIEALNKVGIVAHSLRPRHRDDFADGEAEFDFIFAISDQRAGEPQPEWPRGPITGTWTSPDPTKVNNETERRALIYRTRAELERRLRVFMNLPAASLERRSLRQPEARSTQPLTWSRVEVDLNEAPKELRPPRVVRSAPPPEKWR